jgi:DNA invertase Pin-like site-specific DNA recombinase
MSARYAKENGLVLDNELTLVDNSSGFDGSNLNGQLGKFLESVQVGLVPSGSYLLVESLDRLSRARVKDAAKLLDSIVDSGITVVTLSDGMKYSPTDDASKDITNMIVSLLVMSRAHEESVMKSSRLKAAWSNKRTNISTKKLTSHCPAWLTVNSDRTKFEEIPEKVAIVRQIVDLVRSGQGKGAIAKRLNTAGVESIGNRGKDKSWYESYITKIIKSRALIGEFQPHRMEGRKRVAVGEPIANYYPRILNDEEFALLQNLISERGRKAGGNRGKSFSNLFTGLIKCGYCGSTMVFVDKGIDKRSGNRDQTKNKFLVCHGAKRGLGCHHIPWTYTEFENAFFTYARRVDFEQFVTTSNNRVSELRALNDQLILLRSKLTEIAKRITRAVDAITDSDSPPQPILNRLDELVAEKADIEVQVQKLDAQREALLSRTQMSEGALQALKGIANSLGEKTGDDLFLFRSTLNEYLRRVLDSIILFPGGGITAPERCEEIKRKMIESGRWTEEEVTVFVNAMLHSEPRKHDRFFAIRSNKSTTVVLQPEAAAREAFRRLKGYPDLMADLVSATESNHIMAGRV